MPLVDWPSHSVWLGLRVSWQQGDEGEDAWLSAAVAGERTEGRDREWLVGSRSHSDTVMPGGLLKGNNFLRIARHTTLLG